MASGQGSRSSGKSAGKKTTAGKSQSRTASGKGRGAAAGRTSVREAEPMDLAIRNELVLIGVLALAIFLFLCNFGVVGVVGDLVSDAMFGIFGLISYAAPVLFFLAVAFGISNKGNRIAVRKLVAAVVLFLLVEMACDLLTGGWNENSFYRAKDLFERCSRNHNGGGLIGGTLAYLSYHFLSMVGTVLLMVVFAVVCLVVITEKSVMSGVKSGGQRVYEKTREDVYNRRERAQRRREEQEQLRREREEERRLREEEEENEKILRMDKKVSGVMLDTTLDGKKKKAKAAAQERNDGHGIVVHGIEESAFKEVEVTAEKSAGDGLPPEFERIHITSAFQDRPEETGGHTKEGGIGQSMEEPDAAGEVFTELQYRPRGSKRVDSDEMQEVFFEEDVKDVLLQDTKRIDLGDTKEIVPGRKPAYATALPTRYAIAGQNGQPARQERPLELPGQPEKGVGRPEAMQQQAFMQQGAMQTDAGRMPGQSVTAQGVQSQFELPPGQPQAGAMQMQYAMAPGRPEETPGQPAMAPGQMEAIQYGMASGRPEEMSGQAGMAPGQMENMQMQFGVQSGQMVIQPDAMQGQPGQMQPERLQAQPNLMRRHKPSGFEQMLSQEYDGQISLVVPNSEKLEKQITGQMNIADIMAEWERAKRENEEKRREDVRKRVQRHTGNMFSEFDEATKSGLLEQLEKAVVEAIMKESGKSAVDPSQISEQQLDDIVKSVGRKKEEEDSQPPQTEKEPDEESIVNFAYMKTIAEMAGIDNQAQEPAQDNGENRRPKEEEQGISAEEILRDIVLPEEMEGQELPEEEQAEPDGTAQWTVMEQAGGTEEEDFQAQGFKEARMETDRAEAEALMAQEERVEEPVQEARGDNKNRSLTPEEKELFGRFVHSRKSREQVLHAVGAMSMEPYHGNVIVTGEEEAGTLELSRNLVRMLQLVERDFSGKVAKISGSKLNKKDVQDTLGKLADGALIIEHATGMSSATAADLNQALEKESRGIFVILEGKRDEMNIFLHKNKVLLDNFDARIDIESLDDQALVEYAKQYAEEMEYSIDELGILALHTRIADMQTSDHEVTVAEVKDLVDDAIYFADKKNPKHFFDVLFGKRYDAEDMIILREKDFMHY